MKDRYPSPRRLKGAAALLGVLLVSGCTETISGTPRPEPDDNKICEHSYKPGIALDISMDKKTLLGLNGMDEFNRKWSETQYQAEHTLRGLCAPEDTIFKVSIAVGSMTTASDMVEAIILTNNAAKSPDGEFLDSLRFTFIPDTAAAFVPHEAPAGMTTLRLTAVEPRG